MKMHNTVSFFVCSSSSVQPQAANLQRFIDKFSAGTKSKSAQSRVKMLAKMKAEGKLDPPPAAVVANVRIPHLNLPPPPKPHGEHLLVLKDATIGYPGEEPLLRSVDLKIPRGMKLLLRGPNGAGKSTLLKALRGNVESMVREGTRRENDRLKLGVFTQDSIRAIVTQRMSSCTAHS